MYKTISGGFHTMQHFSFSKIWIIGLAIFSMLFGAGNIMLAINVGMRSGQHFWWAIAGFILTSVIMPIAGLVSVVEFNGSYDKFFNRIGKVPGQMLIFLIMLIIGPLNVIPRIITLSYTLFERALPENSLPFFTIAFLALTFLATVRESRVIELLGKIISPTLIISLIVIITVGMYFSGHYLPTTDTIWHVFWRESKYGFVTFDLFGTIFFGSIVISLLKTTESTDTPRRSITLAALYGGLLGSAILAIVYFGLAFVGNMQSYGLIHSNEGELLREIATRILGQWGMYFMGIAVLMACFSTAIALMVVVSEYIQKTVAHNKLTYMQSLSLVHILTYFPSTMGLTTMLKMSIGPIASVIYPVVIAITACNLAYQFYGFRPIKVITLVTALISTTIYVLWP
jgi:branched-chain amino acid:cation transporter, LIVCS family